MATLYFADGKTVTDLSSIQQTLNQINVELKHWRLPDDSVLDQALTLDVMDDSQKNHVLETIDFRFEKLKTEQGYTTRDMIVLHEGIADLAEMMKKFERIHYHDDDEVRYILDGQGYFGFVLPDQTQILVEVSSEDYINVPAKTEHWFTMGDSRRIKAVRYFIDTSGWVPVYTDRNILFSKHNLPW